MLEIRNFTEAQAALREFYGKQPAGPYSLELIKALLAHVGNPQDSLRVIHIALVPLAEAEFCRDLGEFLGLVETSGLVPSYFEIMIAFAYWEFARHEVDYAVVEVG